MFLFGCASTSPGRGNGTDASTPVPSGDGGSWSDGGQCPPMTYPGTACKGTTSCWSDCFSCLGDPPTWSKHDPVSFRCIDGEYGAMTTVTCWNGAYKNNTCTIPSDGGK